MGCNSFVVVGACEVSYNSNMTVLPKEEAWERWRQPLLAQVRKLFTDLESEWGNESGLLWNRPGLALQQDVATVVGMVGPIKPRPGRTITIQYQGKELSVTDLATREQGVGVGLSCTFQTTVGRSPKGKERFLRRTIRVWLEQPWCDATCHPRYESVFRHASSTLSVVIAAVEGREPLGGGSWRDALLEELWHAKTLRRAQYEAMVHRWGDDDMIRSLQVLNELGEPENERIWRTTLMSMLTPCHDLPLPSDMNYYGDASEHV